MSTGKELWAMRILAGAICLLLFHLKFMDPEANPLLTALFIAMLLAVRRQGKLGERQTRELNKRYENLRPRP